MKAYQEPTYRDITIRWCSKCDGITGFREGKTEESARVCKYHPEEHIRYTDIKVEVK